MSVCPAELQWKLPSQLVHTRDSLIKSVVSSEILQTQLSLDYLHSSVAAVMSPALMRALDIQALRTEHLLQVGKMLLKDVDKKTEEGKWLILLLSYTGCSSECTFGPEHIFIQRLHYKKNLLYFLLILLQESVTTYNLLCIKG